MHLYETTFGTCSRIEYLMTVNNKKMKLRTLDMSLNPASSTHASHVPVQPAPAKKLQTEPALVRADSNAVW